MQLMSTKLTPLLLACLEELDEQVQAAAADAFGCYALHATRNGEAEEVQNIADAIAEKAQCRRHWIKSAAASALRQVLQALDRPHLKAKSVLIPLVADPHCTVRSSAVAALPYVSPDYDAEVSHALMQALQDPHEEIRAAACLGLVTVAGKANCNWRQLAEKLIQHMGHPLPQTRCAAMATLHELMRRCAQIPELSPCFEGVVRALPPRLRDADGYVRIAAAQTAGCFTSLHGRSQELGQTSRDAAEAGMWAYVFGSYFDMVSFTRNIRTSPLPKVSLLIWVQEDSPQMHLG